ncbi:5'-flap endonuclease [Coniosporium tulheliwenetii]|nr:5'-flap endonuclease [Cladosporium sp. JES 115]
MTHQDILFGTSSQLAREDSPTFIRDLQQAIRESEACVDAEQVSEAAPVSVGSTLALVRASRGLWSAAMRSFDDDLLAAEERNTSDIDLINDLPSAKKAPEPAIIEWEIVEIEDTEADSGAPEADSSDCAEDQTAQMPEMEHRYQDLVRDESLEDQPPPSAQDDDWTILSDDKLATVISTPKTVEPSGTMPSLSGRPTDVNCASVETTNAQHRFHRLKATYGDADAETGSKTPVPQERVVLQPLPINVNVSKPLPSKGKAKRTRDSDPPPKHLASTAPNIVVGTDSVTDPPSLSIKKPRGRPRKTPLSDSAEAAPAKKRTKETAVLPDPPSTPQKFKKPASEWTNIDEIEDSEQDFTPSPPRRSNPPASPPLQLIPPALPTPNSTAHAAPATALFPTANGKPDQAALCAHLFPQITLAIKAAPNTTDPRTPSWHEKMLLYDPIVLEDLTAWLNAQGLRAPGKKGKDGTEKVEELKPWIVQKWCEEKSVCCLWREGLRGGVKNRY